MGAIQEAGVLVRVSIGKWTANKKDKEITAEVAETHGADEDMGRYNKRLVSKDAVDKVSKAATAVSLFVYQNTLPWTDDGYRLLPSANFFDFTAKLRECVNRFDAAVIDFLAEYDTAKVEAKRRLNGLFREDDYPGADELREKFYIRENFTPIPESNDFRVNLAEGEMEALRVALGSRTEQAVQAAQGDMWRRLHEVVERFVDTLPRFDPAATGKERGIFRDSLVGNAVELVDLLERLNFTGDVNLEDLRIQVRDKLTAYSAEELRTQAAARDTVTKDAKAIMATMATFMPTPVNP